MELLFFPCPTHRARIQPWLGCWAVGLRLSWFKVLTFSDLLWQLPLYKYNKYQHSLLTVLGQVRHQIFWKAVVITFVSGNTNDRSGKEAIRSLQQTPFDYPRSTAYISVALWWVIAETGGKNSERWLAPERAFRSPDVRIQSLIIGT